MWRISSECVLLAATYTLIGNHSCQHELSYSLASRRLDLWRLLI
jgi:TRAP-type mannitol/chloroaromatic compound transport system permease small subunit